jgi:hypothetical protein
VRDGWDDEQLLTALRESMRARQAVPSWFVDMGKNAYAWHDIDAELAQLTYDSSTDTQRSLAVRSETASIRALTFTSAGLSIELEVTEGCLLGQVIPPRGGTLEVHDKTGTITSGPIDEIGCFTVEPIPASPFRLRCRTACGIDVVTGWITLLGPDFTLRERRRSARSPRRGYPRRPPDGRPAAPRAASRPAAARRARPA